MEQIFVYQIRYQLLFDMGCIILPRTALVIVGVRLKRKKKISTKIHNPSRLVLSRNDEIFDLIVPPSTFCIDVRKPSITTHRSKCLDVDGLMKSRC